MYIISPILVKLEPDFPRLRGPKSRLRAPNKSLLKMAWPQSKAMIKILYISSVVHCRLNHETDTQLGKADAKHLPKWRV